MLNLLGWSRFWAAPLVQVEEWTNTDGDKSTQAINLFDLMLISVDSGFATEDFHWREPKPCSEKATRVLGRVRIFKFFILVIHMVNYSSVRCCEGYLDKF